MSKQTFGAEPSEPASTTDEQQPTTKQNNDDGDFTDGFKDSGTSSTIGKASNGGASQ